MRDASPSSVSVHACPLPPHAPVIAAIASETTSTSAHLPGSKHALSTDGERSVLMLFAVMSKRRAVLA